VDVYLLDPDADRYMNLTLARIAEVDQLLERFDGRPMRDSWSPLDVEIIHDSPHEGRPACDFPLAVRSGPGAERARRRCAGRAD
jgi:hypothetical protein